MEKSSGAVVENARSQPLRTRGDWARRGRHRCRRLAGARKNDEVADTEGPLLNNVVGRKEQQQPFPTVGYDAKAVPAIAMRAACNRICETRSAK